MRNSLTSIAGLTLLALTLAAAGSGSAAAQNKLANPALEAIANDQAQQASEATQQQDAPPAPLPPGAQPPAPPVQQLTPMPNDRMDQLTPAPLPRDAADAPDDTATSTEIDALPGAKVGE